VRRILSRALIAGAVGAVAFGVGGGVASADTPIWVAPGVDGSALLGPVADLPTTALAPVDQVLTYLAG
jgi:hypothetical protein